MPFFSKSIISAALICVSLASANDQAATITTDSIIHKAFEHKLVYSETPEMGAKWRGGIRNIDLISWDMYWNCNDWFTVDFYYGGLQDLTIPDTSNNDTSHITDFMTIFSIKSRSFKPITSQPWKIAGGLKFMSTTFKVVNTTEDVFPLKKEPATVLFGTTSYLLKDHHYFNLYFSLSTRKNEIGNNEYYRWNTWTFIPGYRYYIGKNRNWSFNLEYYFMNPRYLPFKTLQFLNDPDQNYFENNKQLWVTYMMWGFSYNRAHYRVDINIANHPSFSGPILPLIGFGVNF